MADDTNTQDSNPGVNLSFDQLMQLIKETGSAPSTSAPISAPPTQSPFRPVQIAPAQPISPPAPTSMPPQPTMNPNPQWQMANQQPTPSQERQTVRETKTEPDQEPSVWQKIYADILDQFPHASPKQVMLTMKMFKEAGAFETYSKNGKTTETTTETIKGGIGGVGKTVEEQLYASLIKQGLQPQQAAQIIQNMRGVSPEAKSKGAEAGEIGKAAGSAEIDYAKIQAGLPSIKKTVNDLKTLADMATYTVGGKLYNDALRQLGQPMSVGGNAAAEYQARINNVLLPSLRSMFGARVTNFDIQAAKSMLGDPSLSPSEKKAQLDAFIEQKLEQVKTDYQTVKNLGGTPKPEMQDSEKEETPSSSKSENSAPAAKTVNWDDL